MDTLSTLLTLLCGEHKGSLVQTLIVSLLSAWSVEKVLNTQSSGRWYETSPRAYDTSLMSVKRGMTFALASSSYWISPCHYSDVIMGIMASQITSLTIVYSTVYSGADQRKHQRSASLAFVWGIHRGPVNSPAQMASNAENVSIWWRHHVIFI